MLVYGDPQFQQQLHAFRKHLRKLGEATRSNDLDQLRTLLIQVGQCEQAVADSHDARRDQTAFAPFTWALEHVAKAFFQRWAASANVDSGPDRSLAHLKEAGALLEQAVGIPDTLLTVKVPEGFAFYCLYPEQYCESALRWVTEHQGVPTKRALIVGIRSIGTTLSALIKAVLEARGWQCARVTVRPVGHPFSRRVELGPNEQWKALGPKAGLVVDEGPGLSGSSIAAAGRALRKLGIDDVSFFPGHSAPPGAAASAEVRQEWGRTEKYVTSFEELRWKGLTLKEALVAETNRLENARPHAGAEGGEPCDLSRGLWRKYAFSSEAEWPAVAGTLERTKFLCTGGGRRPVLWKFEGLGCSWGPDTLAASDGSRPSPDASETGVNGPKDCRVELTTKLGQCHGFLAQTWHSGRRLNRQDANNPALLRSIGNYIRATALPALPKIEQRESVQRLARMLDRNSRELLGDGFAETRDRFTQAAIQESTSLSYGDGRMAPWEWVKTESGRLFKTDCGGHFTDHTVIGRQSVLWDAAGVLVEWDLEPIHSPALLESIFPDRPIPSGMALSFYLLAYGAFRFGVCTLFAEQEPARSTERHRLERGAAHYASILQRTARAPAGAFQK